MVLGLKTRNKKGASIQVDYLVHVQEIKPWSLSQSPGSILSLLLRWENGDKNSGSIGPVVPSFESGYGDAKIEFNESFRLMATLSREAPAKGGDGETFQKNYLEFSLYESRREKTVRGKLLGTVLIDLAEYGIVNEIVNIGAPMNCKRSFRNTDQPVLFVRIQPFGKDNSSSSLREILSKESSQEKNEKESISTLMSEEHSEELEIASFTDDDVSSHSSFGMPSSAAAEAGGSSPPQNLEVPEKSEEKPLTFSYENVNGNSCLSSIDLSSDPGSPENDHASSSKFPWSSLSLIPRESVSHSFQSFSSYIADEDIREETRPGNSRLNYGNDNLTHKAFHEKSGNEENQQNDVNTKDLLALFSPSDTGLKVVKKTGFVDYSNSHTKEKNNVHTKEQNRNETANADDTSGPPASPVGENGDWEEQGENGVERQIKKEKLVMAGGESSGSFSSDSTKKQVSYPGFTRSLSRRSTGVRWNAISDDKKSIPSSLDLPRSNGLLTDNKLTSKVKEIDVLKDVDTGSRSFIIDEVKDATLASRDTRNSFSDGKVQHLEHKIERLEVELKEAAAIEIGLYSVVAEHGSSASKIHSPARRVSRLYLHALRECLPARISSAARSAVSGLVLVAKACGNDVPRLTFWLSNLIVLRAVINQAIEESQLSVSASSHIENDGGGKGNSQRSSTFNWKESSPTMREKKLDLAGYSDDWENPHTFTSVLEKIEAWIFSRIVESVWWQTLTPHMQSTNGEASDKNCGSGSKKCYGRKSSLIDQEQGNLSVELWKKAIKDAYERLCPVRAEGHECGCLPVLVRLVMEQCVARLDVAMFNAILRESGDEIPTDPVSDPISDTKVLPIPVGKASFGAGAQLKNSVGSWSRWLTDLLGIDDDDLPEGKKLDGGYRHEFEASFKPFNLLNALSDLMMLPKDLLLSSAIRKEVCPAFGAALIQRVLNIFVPDEFCPDPIPEALFQALDSEDSLLAEGQSIQKFPCTAAPVVYVPPPAASVAGFIGSGSQSQLLKRNASILQKSNTSDDELDELDSPLASILGSVLGSHTSSTSSTWKSKKSGVHNVIRYQLLREAWRDYA